MFDRTPSTGGRGVGSTRALGPPVLESKEGTSLTAGSGVSSVRAASLWMARWLSELATAVLMAMVGSLVRLDRLWSEIPTVMDYRFWRLKE